MKSENQNISNLENKHDKKSKNNIILLFKYFYYAINNYNLLIFSNLSQFHQLLLEYLI